MDESQPPLSALLVSADAEVLDGMRRALGVQDFTIQGDAWPGIEAVQRAADLQPDVVLFHVEPPLGPAGRTVQAVAAAAPSAGIAVLSSSDDVDTIRRVMNAGAHDFATLPLRDDAFRDAALRARRAVRHRSADRGADASVTGTVITVAGPRGGVGKTTLATNLAIALAQETSTAVAIADLDVLFGATAIAMGVMPDLSLQDWLRARSDGTHAPASRFLADHPGGVHLLSAPAEPDPDLDFSAEDVAALLADLSSTHEYVVIDTGASFGEITATAIELSSLVLMLSSSELASLRATRYVVQLLRGWGLDEDRMRLIGNSPVPVRIADAGEMAQAIGLPVSWTLPHDREVLRRADQGSPVCESRRRSRFARQVRAIARYAGHVPARERRRLLGVL